MDAVAARSLRLVRLHGLMAAQAGRPDLVVAVIDGPAETGHSDLAGARIEVLPGSPGSGQCRIADSVACRHGTLILGMLCARRGSPAPAICPGCTVLLCPVRGEAAPPPCCGPHTLACRPRGSAPRCSVRTCRGAASSRRCSMHRPA